MLNHPLTLILPNAHFFWKKIILYLVKKMKSVQCCGFSLLLWDVGSVVKERLAFAIDDIAIMFQAKVLPKYWKVPKGLSLQMKSPRINKLRSSSSDRRSHQNNLGFEDLLPHQASMLNALLALCCYLGLLVSTLVKLV